MSASLNFSISADQEALVKAARRFGEQHLAPFYKQRESEGAFDRQTLCHMGELGLFCVELPGHYGGLGLDCVTAGLVLEALCRSDYNIGQLMVTMSLAGAILSRHGQPEIVERYLKGVVGGRIIPAIALTEPGGGSDAANLRLRARHDGDS
jgi:cyclohexanecarboxyl-CoA dehydrogenase